MNYEFDLEQTLVNYIEANITGSLNYPIYVGHTPSTSSEDYPKIVANVEGYSYLNGAFSPRKATVHIDVVSVAYDPFGYALHSLACAEIERTMGNLPAVSDWSYNSGSVYIIGIEYLPVMCPLQGVNFLNTYSFTVTGQQMVPSSSQQYVYPVS